MLNISFKKLHSTEIEFPDNNSPDDSKNQLPNHSTCTNTSGDLSRDKFTGL